MSDILNLEKGASIQAQTMLGARFVDQPNETVTRLYEQYWPPVPSTEGLSIKLREHLARSTSERVNAFGVLKADKIAYGKFLHESLGEIYSYMFGYHDGVATMKADDELEIALLCAKVELEREFIDHWLGPIIVPSFDSQKAAADYLDELARTNIGVHHPLFEYLRDHAPREHVEMFLRGEVIRNEVVDDEVAMLITGLQGTQKAVAAANLWDECGRGRLENFHTFWLRRLIDATSGGIAEFIKQREANPWFAKITSNTNNMLLTRPAYKQMAYGCFLIFESWVEPHFVTLLSAMDRLGITNQDFRIYFTAHVAVDPRHSRELSDGMRYQRPELSALEIQNVVRGAHIATEAGRCQYDLWLEFFTKSKAKNQ